MHYTISSSMSSLCRNMDMASAMRMVKQAGFDALDFPFSAYSAVPDGPMCREDWRSWVRRVKELSEELHLPIVQAHASWHQAIGDNFRYESPDEVYFRTMEACRMVGCRHMIFHPLRQPERVDSLSMRRRIHDYNVRWFHELISAAQEYDVTINLENTFDSHHTQKAGDPPYPYTTAQDMLDLMHDIGSTRVALCLDTGHANISGQDIPEMIRRFRSDLATVHLNDNYGRISPIYEDLHLFPGCGRIEWDEVLTALREIRFKGSYNIEPIAELRRMPESVCAIQMRAAGDTLRALMIESDKMSG